MRCPYSCSFCIALSPSTRRAWIEIAPDHNNREHRNVALHPEGVDRNRPALFFLCSSATVALHPEGVDRNIYELNYKKGASVALHPEGVDRNSN